MKIRKRAKTLENTVEKRRFPALVGTLLLAAEALGCAGMLSACSLPFIVVNDPDTKPREETGTAESETAAAVSQTETQTSVSTEAPVQTGEDTDAAVPVPQLRPEEDKETAAETYLSSLRHVNYGGTNVLIAAVGTSAVFGEDTEGASMRSDTLASYRARSLHAVEKKYNVNFITFTYTADELYKEVLKAYNSDTQFVSDLYFIPPRDVGRYQANGLLYNLRSLPFTDFSAPYFDTKAMREASAGYGIWAASGDFTRAPENAYAVYFNRALYKKLGLSLPYDAVEDGTWTWDMLFENARTACTLDGISGDNLTSFSQSEAEELFLASSGLHPAAARIDSVPTVKPNASRMQTIADCIFNNVMKGTTSVSSDAEQLFADGKLLYCVSTLSHVTEWADVRADWGILPLPKCYDGQSAYYTYQGGNCVLCVPSVTATPEMTGVLIQALFASSYGSHIDAYLDDVLRYYARDGRSVDMLEMITQSYYTDFSAMFASGYPNLSAATTGALHRTLTTVSGFEAVLRQTQTAAQNEMAAAFPVED